MFSMLNSNRGWLSLIDGLDYRDNGRGHDSDRIPFCVSLLAAE